MNEKFEKFSDITHCPVRNIISRFSTKWGLLIISVLAESGTVRFNQLNKILPDISPKVLTSTLKALEADGLVHRKLYPCIPPKVEYTITPLGRELAAIINDLAAWGLKHSEEISSNRRKFERQPK